MAVDSATPTLAQFTHSFYLRRDFKTSEFVRTLDSEPLDKFNIYY